jgi:taurine dioxygenase
MYRPAVGARQLNRLAPDATPTDYQLIRIEPKAVTLGAEIKNVDLAQPMSDALFAEVDAAFREWKVIIFRDQDVTKEQFLGFAERWGAIVEDSLPRQAANGGKIVPYSNAADNVAVFTRDERAQGLENIWHVDGSYRTAPVLGTMLAAVEVPHSAATPCSSTWPPPTTICRTPCVMRWRPFGPSTTGR